MDTARLMTTPIYSTSSLCSLAWRVDDLFADLGRALDDTTAAVGVSYDPAYGFPGAYWISHGGADDGHEVLVESFAAARR